MYPTWVFPQSFGHSLPGPPARPPLPGPPSEPSPSEPPLKQAVAETVPAPKQAVAETARSSDEPPLKQAKIVPAPETSEFVHKALPKHRLAERPALAGDCRVPQTPTTPVSEHDDVQKDEKDGGQPSWERSDGWQKDEKDGWQPSWERTGGWQWYDSGDQGKWQKQELASAAEGKQAEVVKPEILATFQKARKWHEWASASLAELDSAIDGQNDGGQHDSDGAARPADAPAAIGEVPQLARAPPRPPKPATADDFATPPCEAIRPTGFGKVPVLGTDVTWFGCRPIETPATEWADDKSFEPTTEFLLKHGLFPKDTQQFCGYCQKKVQDAKWHLAGYSQDSKTFQILRVLLPCTR